MSLLILDCKDQYQFGINPKPLLVGIFSNSCTSLLDYVHNIAKNILEDKKVADFSSFKY